MNMDSIQCPNNPARNMYTILAASMRELFARSQNGQPHIITF